MTNRLKRLLNGTRVLESKLTAAFEGAAQSMAGVANPSAPLEVLDRAVDEVARHVVAAGRGRYAFPFNSVTLTFAVSGAEEEARFNAICAGPPPVHERVMRRLASAGCDLADDDVDVSVAFAGDPEWAVDPAGKGSIAQGQFRVALARVDPASRPPRPTRFPALRIDLLVTHGTADRGAYSFTDLPVAIGRGPEVRDGRHQLLRINHVAFVEGDDDVNKTVSRRHARIELDPHTRKPRLVDDNSAQGTSIIRGGRGLAVPRGSRGLGLLTDDEIVLGQARIKIRIGR